MKKSNIEKMIIEEFKERSTFTRAELFKLMKHYDAELNEQTIGWRVFDLKKKNVIHAVARGIYKVSNKQNYKPQIVHELDTIGLYLNTEFFELEYVIWKSAWLNEFSRHQTINNFTIVEVTSDLIESVYFKLLDFGLKEIFLKPDKDEMYYKVIQADNPTIIKPLITRSPRIKVKNIHYPAIEKIIVDIFSDVNIFYMYQGQELKNMFQNIYSTYNINLSKMINYAKRRNKSVELINYLNKIMDIELEAISND